jgi:hypothetical protein
MQTKITDKDLEGLEEVLAAQSKQAPSATPTRSEI